MTKIKSLFISIDPLENRRRLLMHLDAARSLNWNIFVFTSAGENNSKHESEENIVIKEINLRFKKGPLKFLQFNIALFLHLLHNNYDIIYCRGIWPFPGLLFNTFIKREVLIFDAHEYFPGLELIINSYLRRKIWLWFEKKMSKYISVLMTVSEPILTKYELLYPAIKNKVLIRNIPKVQGEKQLPDDLILKVESPVILFHGVFLPSRGIENLIQAMEYLDQEILLLVGDGILRDDLKLLVDKKNLQKKVIFKAPIPHHDLISFARQATIGTSLLLPVSENHIYAMPNKFFEYIQAGLPVVVSEHTTLAEYVSQYKIGLTANPNDPKDIAIKIKELTSDIAYLNECREKVKKAAALFTYDNEVQKLIEVFRQTEMILK